MRVRQLITWLSLVVASTICHGSEICRTLEEKVASSDLIAVGSVVEVQLKEIRTLRNSPAPTQGTEIRFRIEECLSGKETGEIPIEAHSVSYTDSEGSHAATAGFSSYEVKLGKRFIAYLKKTEDGFVLSGESNQYLEWIDDKEQTVRDIGQTYKMLPLAWKKSTIQKIGLANARAQGIGAGSPAAAPVTAAALVDALERNWSGSIERDSQGHVVTLRVGPQWCNDQSLTLLAELDDLRELTLQGGRTNKLSADGLHLLRQNTNLCSLRLACFFTNLPAGILTELATFPHITQVRLVAAEPNVAEYAVLATMTNLTDLQIHYGVYFGDDELARFTNLPSLRNLIVDSKSLTSNSTALLPQFPTLTNVELRSWTGRTTWKTNWHSGVVPAERRLERVTMQ